VLVGITCVGAFATSRAAARSVVEAARRHRHTDTTVSPAPHSEELPANQPSLPP
jgi:hypothetical protein